MQLQTDARAEESERIVAWRYEVLARAGYREEDALELAADAGVDLHVACDLVERGCPPRTALRILK